MKNIIFIVILFILSSCSDFSSAFYYSKTVSGSYFYNWSEGGIYYSFDGIEFIPIEEYPNLTNNFTKVNYRGNIESGYVYIKFVFLHEGVSSVSNLCKVTKHRVRIKPNKVYNYILYKDSLEEKVFILEDDLDIHNILINTNCSLGKK